MISPGHLIVWVDGALVEEREARISPFDHGLLTGDGVFETLRVYRGEPYCWRRHYERLTRSASGMGLAIPPGPALRRAALDVIAANRMADARLRITVTGGPSPLGSDRGRATPTLILAVSELPPPGPAQPVAVVTAPWPRNERGALAGLKTTSYAENVVALAEAHRRGAHEALFANTRGELCEGTGSNVAVAVDGVLVTPPLSSGCLAGVTRELLLEWASKEGLPVEERPLPISVLETAQDVVLTSTTRDVQPVAVVDGRQIGGAELGRAAAELFARRAAEDGDP